METASTDCPFCSVIAGSDADVVFRSETVVAFLDRRPVFKGHVLVVPARHVATLGELADEELLSVMRVARAVSRADESTLQAQGSFVAINNHVSQSVPHLHVHVVPRTKGDGLRGFFWPRTRYDSDEEKAAYVRLLSEGVARELEGG